jgi:7-cyano-7-deazaguanine synthase in queuosine biosynthesis
MKRICVLWSGGADSTCLVETCLADESYDVVMAGYVHLADQPAKADSEIEAIARMVPILRARDGRFIWLGTLMSVDFDKTNRNLAYKQVPIWLLALVEGIRNEVDEVALGYIKNTHPEVEDVTAHIETIERIYAAYQPLMHGPMPRLVFPLLHLTKAEVLARLSPELRAHTVYCEAPLRDGEAYRPCGRCRICLHRAEEIG